MGVSRSNNHHRRILCYFEELNAADRGHLNIKKDQINGMLTQQLGQTHWAVTHAYELQKIYLSNVVSNTFSR